ncbi:hypothetical protein ACOUJB_01580 [Acinetobacter pittii]
MDRAGSAYIVGYSNS